MRQTKSVDQSGGTGSAAHRDGAAPWDEVAQARWSEIDLDGRMWTLARERVKTGNPHEVPLSKPAIAILQTLPRIGGNYVLTTTGDAPSSNYAKNKRRLDALLPDDMPPWRLHDLRRSAASGMARLGVNLPVIEKVPQSQTTTKICWHCRRIPETHLL